MFLSFMVTLASNNTLITRDQCSFQVWMVLMRPLDTLARISQESSYSHIQTALKS